MRRLVPAVIVGLAIAACGSSQRAGTSAGASDGTGGSITVYSGQHEQTMSQLVKDFTHRTGTKVTLRSDDEATLANQLLQEGSSSPADVFVAENPPALTALAGKDLLAAVLPATLSTVPATYSSPEGTWLAVSARTAALVYNTTSEKPADLPLRILDLATPAWKGKVGFAPGETDFQPLITAIIALHGKDAANGWLKGLKANARTYDDNEGLIAAVNSGEIATGLVDHYYWYRLRDEVPAKDLHSALHSYSPGDAGNLVDVSGAAVLRSSKHPAQAQAFLAYLVSEAAQTIIATSESYEYPLRPGVTDTRLSPSLADLKPPTLPAQSLGDGKVALDLLTSAGLL